MGYQVIGSLFLEQEWDQVVNDVQNGKKVITRAEILVT